MLNTLYKKLAAALFVVLSIIGACLLVLYLYSAEMYQQEVNQKLNTSLADHIITEDLLMQEGKINHAALDEIFHMLMVINPNIEVYLLDVDGNILAYSAPDEKIKLSQVSLTPISSFLAQQTPLPIKGDDPRHLNRQKVFSVATISSNGPLEGYLYVILGSEAFDSVTEMIRGSYILQISLLGLAISLLVALIAGLSLFSLQTRRLTYLSTAMSCYLDQSKIPTINASPIQNRYPLPGKASDEIDALGQKFNVMADKIDAQLEELKANDAKRRELIANVSHDLKTPLTSLQGYLETLSLKENTITAEERKRYLKIVTSHSQRLGQLVTELFELAKLDSVETLLNVEAFSLGELIQDVAQKYHLTANRKNINLNTEFGQDVPLVYGDIGLIQRVLENLIDNAIRYTPGGGTITLALSNNQDNIIVKVIDTGCGIPEEEIPHIFNRFYRSKSNANEKSYNSGLGLAITKRILNLHGSNISANSHINKGTTFSFQLPARSF
ncbi:MAG: sensor histidine kinase [Gammaproteobacteria bacterium]|nr:sensor histidine kinase [Gammaproteobacteria bacterium]